MRDAHAPTGELALMNNFGSLSNLTTNHGEALETYMSRIRTTVNLLRGGNVRLHPILINLLAVRGLDSAYEIVKHNITIHSKHFTSLMLDELERKCRLFANAARNVQSDPPTLRQRLQRSPTNQSGLAPPAPQPHPTTPRPHIPHGYPATATSLSQRS